MNNDTTKDTQVLPEGNLEIQTLIAEKDTKIIEHPNLLEAVLKGVPDIIGVHRADHTVLFYNQAGYDFFAKKPEDVIGGHCFEVLGRQEPCLQCGIKLSVKTKKMEVFERFIPELNRYMDCRYSPILNEEGDVIIVVEQLRDITPQKKYQDALHRSEERYRNLFEASPDGMGVIHQGKLVMINTKLANMLGFSTSREVEGRSIFDFLHPQDKEHLKQLIERVMMESKDNALMEYKFIREDGDLLDVEVASTPFDYQGKAAVHLIFRDISERKKDLNRAAAIQNQRMDTKFPLPNRGALEMVYMPANMISGDFFHFYAVSEDYVVGLLGDVSGKGLSAALSTSAIKVLFYEIACTGNPREIIDYLNNEVSKYLGEEYVATCCFGIDFRSMKAQIVGAGINKFFFDHQGRYSMEETVAGPFLGMLEGDNFDEKMIDLKTGDRLFFYTDGFEDIIEDQLIMEEFIQLETLLQQKEMLKKILKERQPLSDDTTWLGIEIK